MELFIAEDNKGACIPQEVRSTGLSWPSRRLLHPAEVDSYSLYRTCSCDRNVSSHRHIFEFLLEFLEFWQVLHVVFSRSNNKVLKRNTKTF